MLALNSAYPFSELSVGVPVPDPRVENGENDTTRLRELNRKLIRLLGHELASPLTVITGYLKLWQEQGTVAYREDLDLVAEQAVKLGERLDDLLLLDQFLAGSAAVKSEPVLIADLLAQVVREFGSRFAAKTLTPVLHTHCRGLVLADAELIRRALRHLLVNAITFSPPGGRVSLAAREDNGVCAISIADEGVGIPPEEHARIFEPFFQMDQSRSRRHPGLGIGLPLVRAIVERHGGRVGVASQCGRGSTFTITLPLW